MIGSVLKHYKIVRHLGSGGMGDVYQAEDTKLHRQVALKFLPREMADDVEGRERFQREAKAVAALDHPNIVSIYSVEESDGWQFLVLQLAEGNTLHESLSRGPLLPQNALQICQQVSSALEAAHNAGIIHRDLKPSNIIITPDGRAKVLDFGIAKDLSTQADPDATLTPTDHLTQTGHILGTAPYMSPECVRGQPPDKGADIWAFGCVMYETLTGRRAFDRETFADTLAAIIEVEPDWEGLPRSLPANARLLVQRCLRKDTKRRVHDITSARIEVEDALDELRGLISAPSLAHPIPSIRRPTPRGLIVGASAIAIAATALMVWTVWPSGEDAASASGSENTAPTEATQLTELPGEEMFPSLNPNGGNFAYARSGEGADTTDIWLQIIGGTRPVNLTEGSGWDDTQPAFSPDGQRIAFRSERAGGGIFVMAADGGFPAQLTDEGYDPAWSPDGSSVIYATESSADPTRFGFSELWMVDVGTPMDPRLVAVGDAARPSFSPIGDRIVYSAISEENLETDLWTVATSGEDAVQLTADEHEDVSPVWAGDGSVYFLSDRGGAMGLWRLPIDPETGAARGEPSPVAVNNSPVDGQLTVAADGSRLAWVSNRGGHSLERIAFDPDAGEFVGYGGDITPDPGAWSEPSANSAGDLVILWQEPGSDAPNLVRLAPNGSSRQPLTNDDAAKGMPRWSPQGQIIAFHSDRSGSFEIWSLDVATPGVAPRQVTDTPGANVMFPIWSPDGERMAYTDSSNHASHILSFGGPFANQPATPLPAVGRPGEWFEAWSWSPDGGRLAGLLRRGSAALGIATYSFASMEYEQLTDSGSFPVWLGDSRRLLFHQGGKIVLLDTRSGERRDVSDEATAAVGERFALSPDNGTIYYTIESRESEIWTIALR